MKLESIAIYKPQQITSFEVGQKLWEGEKETDTSIEKITLSFFGTVRVFVSDKRVLIFRGFPTSYVA